MTSILKSDVNAVLYGIDNSGINDVGQDISDLFINYDGKRI